MQPPSKAIEPHPHRKVFLVVAWCVWAIGPAGTVLSSLTGPPADSGDRLYLYSGLPYSVGANAVALIVLLLAASRWEGWRCREFLWLLGYFCLLSITTTFARGFPWHDDALNWVTACSYLLTILSALALPARILVGGIREANASWRSDIVDIEEADAAGRIWRAGKRKDRGRGRRDR